MWRLQSKSIPQYAAGVVAAIGLGVIAGWLFGLESLMTVFPGLIRMKANSAVTFLFAAVALYLAYKRKHRGLQAACALLVSLIGMATLFEYFSGIDVHIDQLLFLDLVQALFPGRMAPFTAANFLVAGAMLYPFRFQASEKVADILAVIVGFASTFAVVGYLYGAHLLYGSIVYTAMAIHTGFAFLMLSLGFLFIQKEQGFVRIFHAETSGGVVARHLVPAAILIPIFVGLVFNRFNFGQPRLGIAFIVVCNILLIVAAIWSLAFILDKSEIARGIHQQASEIDGLTGIHNRRYFDRRLREEIQRCVRHSRHSCLILFDLDSFKSLNDCHGHQFGDLVLQKIAQTCAQSIRATDVICRYGGEEFAVIAAETIGVDAMILARKIRNMVRLIQFEKKPVRITISSGVAQIGHAAVSSELAIAAADQALYHAKKLGRDRECLYDDINVADQITLVN
jgi:diguanylate cyclase (GGDEF)-like protein